MNTDPTDEYRSDPAKAQLLQWERENDRRHRKEYNRRRYLRRYSRIGASWKT
jgi:hypothetical protein